MSIFAYEIDELDAREAHARRREMMKQFLTPTCDTEGVPDRGQHTVEYQQPFQRPAQRVPNLPGSRRQSWNQRFKIPWVK